jgi:aryl-alcohol dehydrogenase-like predicted oxidoreductase
VLAELGIGATTYGALSRGLLSGSQPAVSGDFRANLPRFTGNNLEQNRQLVDKLKEIAAGKGITQVQLAIAWVLAKGSFIVPVVGARTRAQLAESLGALAKSNSAPMRLRQSRRRFRPMPWREPATMSGRCDAGQREVRGQRCKIRYSSRAELDLSARTSFWIG